MPKLYGISLDSLAECLGVKFQKVEGVQDQLWIFKTTPSSHKASCDDWLEWIVSCTKQLYRCPSADDETIRRRVEEGECLGMAYRFARRFTCSTVSVSHIQKQKNAGLHHFWTILLKPHTYFWPFGGLLRWISSNCSRKKTGWFIHRFWE